MWDNEFLWQEKEGPVSGCCGLLGYLNSLLLPATVGFWRNVDRDNSSVKDVVSHK